MRAVASAPAERWPTITPRPDSWIADANTYEYMIRLQPGQSNGRTWIAIPTFTDVEFWVDVTDTAGSQQSKSYYSAPGNRTLLYDPFFFIYP